MPGFLRFVLIPFSWIWAVMLQIRHSLYDWGIFPSKEAALPCVIVGNLALGGTGKTPHTLWLAKHFCQRYSCAVLSRGYGRNTRGFLEVKAGMTAADCGDEALEYLQELEGKVIIAVCEDRPWGVQRLKELHPELKLVILDDALQHRALRGGYRIMLSTCDKPWYRDYLIPTGTLRDIKTRAQSCDALILSKCGEEWKDVIAESQLKFSKQVATSGYIYGEPIVARGKMPDRFVALAAIANPSGFIREIQKLDASAAKRIYRDHHTFTPSEMLSLAKICREENRGIATTRKDFMRLEPWMDSILREIDIVYFPVKTHFFSGEKELLAAVEEFCMREGSSGRHLD